jgi:hypothetical protein
MLFHEATDPLHQATQLVQRLKRSRTEETQEASQENPNFSGENRPKGRISGRGIMIESQVQNRAKIIR